jgi:hypothetical protein
VELLLPVSGEISCQVRLYLSFPSL